MVRRARKEIIIAEADNSDYVHGGVYETAFSDEKYNYESIIGTRRRWKGKVKITIESIDGESNI